MPAPWVPNLTRSPNSRTPEVPKSWSSSALPSEEVSSAPLEAAEEAAAEPRHAEEISLQRRDSGSDDLMDRFLSGLAPGDPGYKASQEGCEPTLVNSDSISLSIAPLAPPAAPEAILQVARPLQRSPERASAAPPSPHADVMATQPYDDIGTFQAQALDTSAAACDKGDDPLDRTARRCEDLPSTQLWPDAPLPATQLVEEEAPKAEAAVDFAAQVCPELPSTQLHDDSALPATQLFQEEATSSTAAAAPAAATDMEASTVTPSRPPRQPRQRQDGSASKCRMPLSKSAGSTAATFGHTLSPAQQGSRVAVVGDGWGSREGGYEAIVTEADHYTFTVIATSGEKPWTESHVLKEHCIFLAEASRPSKAPAGASAKRQRRA